MVIFRRGPPPNRDVECSMQWYGKYRYFRPISRFISEMVQDRVVVTMEYEQETIPKLLNGTVFNDLERPL